MSQRLALTNIFRITICQLFLQGSPFTIACIQAMCKSHWAETWPCARLAWMQLTNTKFIQFCLAKNIRFFCLQMLKFRCLSKLIKDKGTTLENVTPNPKASLEFKLNWKPTHQIVCEAYKWSLFIFFSDYFLLLSLNFIALGSRKKH